MVVVVVLLGVASTCLAWRRLSEQWAIARWECRAAAWLRVLSQSEPLPGRG